MACKLADRVMFEHYERRLFPESHDKKSDSYGDISDSEVEQLEAGVNYAF